jgi:dynein heavy chain
MDESVLLMKAIHDMNIPKWVEEDIPLFRALLEVIFYGVRLNQDENMVLKNAIEAELRKNGLQPTDDQMLKVM